MVYLLVFACTAAVSLLVTRALLPLAHRHGWLDQPSPRRIHLQPTPRLGGLAMYAALALSLGVLALVRLLPAYTAAAIVICGGVLMLVGLVDDLWGLPASAKLLFQVLVAVATVVGFQISIRAITLPWLGSFYLQSSAVGYALTVFWLLGMINTVNLSDGIDGLAAGLASVFALVLFVVGLRIGQENLPLYACALGGAAVGFLRYNFPPARVFMGDSGSMFLGYTIGALSVLGTAKLATGLLVMGLPVADVAYSIVRRHRTGAPVQLPDKEHLHHRFISMGMSQRQTALLFYALALAFGSGALVQQREGRLAVLVLLGCVSLLIIWYVNGRLTDARRSRGKV